ncbi:MAG: class I SAM-dependent methyltransferase [Candidatus Spyradocola sp.]
MEELRLAFDRIPESFDKWRPRYCAELFDTVIDCAGIDEGASMLEIGPGTGQATEPFLKTGCDYTGIELGGNFAAFLREKFAAYPNLHIVQDDFVPHDFGEKKFNLILSAATIQWIPEKIAFSKTFDLLAPGGVLAMCMTYTDERTKNGSLYDEIQRVYDEHFRVETPYTCKLDYENAVHYGYTDLNYREWKRTRVYTAEEYVSYLAATQVMHITLEEPYRSRFFGGVREAVKAAGNRIALEDTIALYLTKKP